MSAHQLSWRSGTSFWQRGVDPRSLAQREAALGTIAPPNNPAAISEGCANESRFHQLSIIDGRHSRRPFSREIIDGMSLAAYLPRFTQGYRIRSRSNSPNRPRQLPNPIDYLGKSAIDYRGHAQDSANQTDRAMIATPTRKPSWLRAKLPGGLGYAATGGIIDDSSLHTVCQSARCPNLGECWSRGTANTCSRRRSICRSRVGRRPKNLRFGRPSALASGWESSKAAHSSVRAITPTSNHRNMPTLNT